MTRSAKTPKYNEFNQHPLCYSRFQEHTNQLASELEGKKVMLELGAGEAHVGLEFARNNPDWLVLALDRKSDRLLKAARRATDEDLTNIRFIQSDLAFLEELVDLSGKVDLIWVTFPDPYFKDRQKKHRLTGPSQRAIFSKYFKAGGKLRFKTDNLPLFLDTLASIDELGDFAVHHKTADLHQSTLDYDADVRAVTKYEARFVAQGLKINYLEAVFVKTQP